MPQVPKTANPFYVLLVLTGCAFTLTASAYGVMAVRQLHPDRVGVSSVADDRFVEMLDNQGPKVMLLELMLLGIGTVGAIAVDRYFASQASGCQEISRARDNASAGDRITRTEVSTPNDQERPT